MDEKLIKLKKQERLGDEDLAYVKNILAKDRELKYEGFQKERAARFAKTVASINLYTDWNGASSGASIYLSDETTLVATVYRLYNVEPCVQLASSLYALPLTDANRDAILINIVSNKEKLILATEEPKGLKELEQEIDTCLCIINYEENARVRETRESKIKKALGKVMSLGFSYRLAENPDVKYTVVRLTKKCIFVVRSFLINGVWKCPYSIERKVLAQPVAENLVVGNCIEA